MWKAIICSFKYIIKKFGILYSWNWNESVYDVIEKTNWLPIKIFSLLCLLINFFYLKYQMKRFIFFESYEISHLENKLNTIMQNLLVNYFK